MKEQISANNQNSCNIFQSEKVCADYNTEYDRKRVLKISPC